jgi:CheY-like chemotaxis protein
MASVLYVEDEESDVFFMRRAFRRAGMEQALQVVVDGQEAIDYLAGRGTFSDRLVYPMPALILLDLNLPTVSGFQVLRWLRAQPELEDLPAVVFSSSAREEDRTQARQLGANDYLEKPGSGLEFAGVLEELCKRWLPLDRDPAAVGPLSGHQS